MKRLWVQQTLALSVVIIVIMSTVAILVNTSAVEEFREYIILRDMRGGMGSGREELVAYYQRRGSWEGVESLLAEGVTFDDDRSGILLGATSAEIGPEEKEKEADVLLADAEGRVVFGSEGERQGELLSPRELANASPIIATDDANVDDNNEPIGYLLLFFSSAKPVGELEQRFLDRVEQVLFIGAALAVVSMLVVGALLNRRLNALRHTPPNGSVTVTATRVGRALEIAVSDTGEGIAPDDLSHVFERFWRVDPARSRGDDEASLGSGTGLGLAVAQSLVEALGGRIWVGSTPGEGSVFRFTLPLAQTAQ